MTVDHASLDRGGMAMGVGAYTLWGFLPAFWAMLAPAAPPEVLAHRILWTAVLMSVALAVVHGWRHRRAGWAGFALVWAALTIFTVDLVRRSRRGAPAQPVRSTV